MLETRQLVLHSGSPDDWQELHKNLWSRPEVFEYMFCRACTSEDESKAKTGAYAAMHKEVKTEFFVYEKSSGQPIGIAGIKKMADGVYTVTDIAIGSNFWERGYGKEILHALIELAFDKLGAKVLRYECFKENTASRCLACSCGFRCIRTAKAELNKNGREVLLEHFEIRK